MRETLLSLMAVGLAAADAGRPVRAALPPPPGRLFVLAAGKAAAPMAAAVEAAWLPLMGHRLRGLCVVPDGHGLPLERIELAEAAHPVPDARSEAAGRRALAEATVLGPGDMLLALISGGASALLCVPAAGLSLADKQRATRELLASGVPIAQVNAVRRRLSAIKGGGLLRAASPATVVTLIASDVPGDDPALVGSGPTLLPPADPPGLDTLIAATGLSLPPAAPTRSPAGPAAVARIILRPADMLAAVVEAAQARSLEVRNLGDRLEADAETLAQLHADHAANAIAAGETPLILSGGEAGVRVTGSGRGGRNGHFLLALALALESRGLDAHALAIDTDGIDGNSPVAGACLAPGMLAGARARGIDPRALLDACESHAFWKAVGGTIETGCTRSNLNDLRLLWPTRGA
jgi:hydroxypyruvate reductase